MKIGYLGPSGSHSHVAAELFVQQCLSSVQENMTFLPMMGFTQIMEAVEEKALEIGCVPIENALEGSVAEVLDSLAFNLADTQIVAEFVRPIQHALIRRYEFMDGIAFVHSHPQAIGQCREAVYALLGPDIKFIPESSTSEAVKALVALDDTHAALGSAKAAQHYGMEVLVDNIGDLCQNATRFLVVSALSPSALSLQCGLPETPLKTSLCVGLLENRPGALLEILTLMARYNLNMSKIESRPTKQSLGEYLFYLDVEGEIPSEAEQAIRKSTSLYKRLGTYPVLGMLT